MVAGLDTTRLQNWAAAKASYLALSLQFLHWRW